MMMERTHSRVDSVLFTSTAVLSESRGDGDPTVVLLGGTTLA